jgi:proline racemase
LNLKTIDAHVAGQGLRLVVDGFPAPRGRDMFDKHEWAARHADRLRRILMLEPRGHSDLAGAVLTEAVSPGAHAGMLFMNSGGYSRLSVQGVAGATAIALQRGLLMPGADTTILYDTAAGPVRVRSENAAPDSRALAVVSVPSFVLHPGVPVKIEGRQLLADVTFAGRFYAVVGSEAAGAGVTASLLPELRRTAIRIVQAIESRLEVAHPANPRVHGLDGVVFTGPASEARADLRTMLVLANGATDRSPSGTGTAAVLAVLTAMGILEEGATLVTEGLIGTHCRARVAARTRVEDYDAIVPEIVVSAWITGEHTFTIDPADPFPEGFQV